MSSTISPIARLGLGGNFYWDCVKGATLSTAPAKHLDLFLKSKIRLPWVMVNVLFSSHICLLELILIWIYHEKCTYIYKYVYMYICTYISSLIISLTCGLENGPWYVSFEVQTSYVWMKTWRHKLGCLLFLLQIIVVTRVITSAWSYLLAESNLEYPWILESKNPANTNW